MWLRLRFSCSVAGSGHALSILAFHRALHAPALELFHRTKTTNKSFKTAGLGLSSGRLVGAEEASSAKTIGGNLRPEEAVAWELFSPIHRILIVAVVAVAAANSKKNKQICQLKNLLNLGLDQVLLSMQQKLDKLCEQMNYFKDQPECVTGLSLTKKLELPFREASSDENLSFGCGCQLCEQHKPPSSDSVAISVVKASGGDDMFKYKIPPANEAEPEERRMSDLSDLSPSISSSVDIQLNTLAIEQDIYNLRKECEEKEATIKELSIFVHSSQVVDSKRIVELEDIIRRKNMIITKLRKDMLVLEQKKPVQSSFLTSNIPAPTAFLPLLPLRNLTFLNYRNGNQEDFAAVVVNLTRLRRPSFSTASSNERRLPMMADNVLYDMDSTTSPSSSDSDCSP
ncbi:unnamed protein product, partial [Ilex paraguariensis]